MKIPVVRDAPTMQDTRQGDSRDDAQRDVQKASPRDEPRGRFTEDALDPIVRHHAQIAPPLALAPALPDAPIVRARASLEEVLPAIVRRIAWSGDAKRGAVRIELGAGALAGATLLVESEDGRVRVRLDAPPGVDAEAWRARIAAPLAERRIEGEAIQVDWLE